MEVQIENGGLDVNPTHTLLAPHAEWPIGTPCELRASRKEGERWVVLVRVADRQKRGGSWPEFVLDADQIRSTGGTDVGQNKAQKRTAEAEAQRAQAGQAATETAAQTLALTPAQQDAIDLCGPKLTARAAKGATKASAKPEPPRPICGETKKDGTQCTARCYAKDGVVQNTCVDHRPAWEHLTHEEHVAFGEWLKNARGPEIVEVIGWWKAKQIAADRMAENVEGEVAAG